MALWHDGDAVTNNNKVCSTVVKASKFSPLALLRTIGREDQDSASLMLRSAEHSLDHPGREDGLALRSSSLNPVYTSVESALASAKDSVSSAVIVKKEEPGKWAELPDDIMVMQVLGRLHPSYVHVLRSVCHGWRRSAARYITKLRPEQLDGRRLAERFPKILALDLSECCRSVISTGRHTLAMHSELTDDSLQEVAYMAHQLIGLSLQGCSCILGGTGFACIAQLSWLSALDLSQCSNLRDEGLRIVAKLTVLASLDLRGCSKLTDAGLLALYPLQNLQHLGLGDMPLVTDFGMKSIAQLTGLESLSIVRLQQLTIEGFECLQLLPVLRHLAVIQCHNVPQIVHNTLHEGLSVRWSQPLTRHMRIWLATVLADLRAERSKPCARL